MIERRTLLPYLLEAPRHGRRAAFVHRGPFRVRRVTFPDLHAMACRFGHWLDAQGLRKGDRMLLWGPSGPDWAAAFLGAMARGVIVVPLDDVGGAAFAGRVQARARARLAVVGRGCADAAREGLPADLPRVVLEDLAGLVGGQPASPPPDAGIESRDTLEVVFTSGTTSEPKGVVISHRNVLANLVAIERVYRRWDARVGWLVRRRPVVTLLPLSHAFGQAVGLFVPLMMGLSPVFLASPSPAAIREALRAEGAFVLMAVPRFLSSLREELEADLARRGSLEAHLLARARLREAPLWRRVLASLPLRRRFGWRACAFVVGGSALDVGEEEAWRAMGYLVVQGYGLTETAPIVSIGNPFARRAGTVGKALGEQEIRLAPDGEVLVRGANVTEGYWGEAAASAVDADGWLHTGDLGELDDRGRLRIIGRSKDVIVTAEGLNVHARDVEAVLREDAAVRDAAVIGLPGKQGDEVHAVLLLRHDAVEAAGGAEAAASASMRRANERLRPYQRIRSVTAWPGPDFPRTTGTQKVMKRELVRALTERAAGATAPGDVVARVLASRGAGVEDSARLGDLDLSSLELVELVARLEGEAHVDVDDAAVTTTTTVGDLRTLLAGEGAASARAVEMPRWAATLPARCLGEVVRAAIAGPLVAWSCRPFRVRGREHLESLSGPVLLVANHQSYFDAPVLYRALPWRRRLATCSATATEPFAPYFTEGGTVAGRAWGGFKWLLVALAFHAFPMPRAAGFRRSLGRAAELVGGGLDVLVFPEGRMSRTDEMQAFRGGIGILATELGVPVVPIRLKGLREVYPVGAPRPAPGPVEVVIGPPLRFDAGEDRAAVARRLKDAVAGL